MTTSIVIGATGLVGKQIVTQLMNDPGYSSITVLARRATGLSHAKLTEHVVDFGKPESWAALVKGDVLFSALGTTKAQAGSIEAQRTVDYTYQYEAAKAAAANGVPTYVLCSASSASATSMLAYSKMKGELDRDVLALPFTTVQIMRPGLLVGERETHRAGEAFAEKVVKGLNALGIYRSGRPIQGAQVARAMINAAKHTGRKIYEAGDVFRLEDGSI